MSTTKIAMGINLRQNKNSQSAAYGKYSALNEVVSGTLTLSTSEQYHYAKRYICFFQKKLLIIVKPLHFSSKIMQCYT